MTTLDCIDSCIILGTIFEEDELCKAYLDVVGYKQKNKGLLTIPLIGEIFTNLFLKINDKTRDDLQRKVFMQNAVDFFDGTVLWLMGKERLFISKLEQSDFQHIARIKELDYAITDDDAIQLSVVINKKCQRFITTDKVLLREKCKSKIRAEFGLIITPPS